MRVLVVVAMLMLVCGIASAETGTFGWQEMPHACGTITYTVEYVSAGGDTTLVNTITGDVRDYYSIPITIEWGEYIMRVTGTVVSASGQIYSDVCETPVCVGGVQAAGCEYIRTGD